MDESCVFCSIVAGTAPAQLVLEDDETVAFLDIHPACVGHTLVIPRQHYRNLFDIPAETAAAVMRGATRVGALLRQVLEPDGMNLFQASERAGFQSVFHFHVHVIPRWHGDGIRPPWRPGRTDAPVLDELGERLRAAAATDGGTEVRTR
jgi:histidine triad (HIT) family protein